MKKMLNEIKTKSLIWFKLMSKMLKRKKNPSAFLMTNLEI